MSSKCEECGGTWNNLFEIVDKGRTKIVCFACNQLLTSQKSTGNTITVTEKTPTKRGGILW